jgi:hypothetical protein
MNIIGHWTDAIGECVLVDYDMAISRAVMRLPAVVQVEIGIPSIPIAYVSKENEKRIKSFVRCCLPWSTIISAVSLISWSWI